MRLRAIFLAVALVAAFPASAQQAVPPPTNAAPGPNQRYIIVFSPHVNRNTFLLDTATGRAWQLTEFSYLNGNPLAWVLTDRVDGEADELKMEKRHGTKPPQAASK